MTTTGYEHQHLHKKGRIRLDNKDYPAALAHFSEALTLAEKRNDRESMLDNLFFIGTVLHICGQFDDALETFKECERLAHRLGEKPMLSRITGKRAEIHLSRGNLELAMRSFDRSISYAAAAREVELMALGYEQRGKIFAALKDIASAIQSYERAAALFEDAGHREQSNAALENARKLRESAE